MQVKHDTLKTQLSEVISKSIQSRYPEAATLLQGASVSLSDFVYGALVTPPDISHGHLAFPCFHLAKVLKSAPPKIAQELALELEQAFNAHEKFALGTHLQSVKAAGPYINFLFTPKAFGEGAVQDILIGHYFKRSLTENTPRTMIEFSQPNTHKELHVGHMRNLCLGDALIRLHRYIGYDIVSSTFPGDVGTHVAKCLWYLKTQNQEKPPLVRKGAWLGRMYSTANNLLEDQRGTPQEELNRKALTEILSQLEKKQGEYYDLWKETREWSIELMNEVYRWANVKFDVWYWESDVDADSLKLAKEYFKKGVFVESEGAIGIDLRAYDLGFCLLIKSDGNGLYATKDIELARRKFQEHKIERSVYVVDKRQALHFKQVFKTLEIMGFENAKNCFHLAYDFVELPDGAMSSRKGNIVPLQDLVDQMVKTIKTEFLSRYEGIWTAQEIEQTANDVARGAIKYGMIRMDNNRKIVFDMKEWLRIDGESGPYIQYTHARIVTMCEKLGFQLQTRVNWSVLVHPTENSLLQFLNQFNEVVVHAAENYKTLTVCAYLYDLSKKYNAFYAECSVGNAETPELKEARLALSWATAKVLEKGLELLGIPAPKRM